MTKTTHALQGFVPENSAFLHWKALVKPPLINSGVRIIYVIYIMRAGHQGAVRCHM